MNGSKIELRELPSGRIRDYLDGSPIKAGDLLLLWATGQWVTARYELVDGQSHEVMLYAGDGEAYRLDRMEMRFRWPHG